MTEYITKDQARLAICTGIPADYRQTKAIDAIPAANVIVLNWIKCTDHKSTAFKPVFATLNNKDREVIEAYYDPRKNGWCYPHSFGTAVEGEVIAWAEKIGGYIGD